MNIDFSSHYDDEWDEWVLVARLGVFQFELHLIEIFNEDDEPTGEYHLLSYENISGKGSGLGRSVLNALKDWVKLQGGCSLSTSPGGDYLYEMYKDVGFAPTSDEVTWRTSLTS